MAYKYYILSTPDDFYMADAICRELEKTGESCYYNLRDSRKADKMPDSYDKIGSETSLISVVNEEFFTNHSLSSPVSFYSKKTTEDRVFALQNGSIKEVPQKWNKFVWLDAAKGLNREIISIIKGEYEVVNNIPYIVDTIEAAKDQENSYNNSSEKKENGANVMQIVPEVNSIELVSDQQQNSTSSNANLTHNRGEDNIGEGNSQSNTQSSHSSSIGNSNAGNDPNNKENKHSGVENESTEAFIRRMQAVHANLPTIMTKMPTNTDYDSFYFDRVSEAYLVPLYVLPFERCESIPNPNGWFSNLQNPALTIQRALRYLYGNGVPQDENRAFSLFQKSVNEDSSSGEAKYCLGVCKEVGLGTDVDVDSAIQLYKEALELGYPYAASRLGSIYYSKGNLELAKQFIQQARKNNDIESSYLLGLIAEDNGNLEDAIEYYSEAAELGDAKAQNAIAALYYNGTGVAQDEDIAIQWLNQSLDQGFKGASYNRLVYKLNAIDKAIPDMDELNNISSEIDIVDNELRKRHTALKMPGIYYNFSILIRRRNAPIETFKTWFEFPAYCKLPYVDEFYRHYENEKKRRKKSGIEKTVLNGLLSVMGAINNTDTSASMQRGGFFDKEREI